MIPQTVESARTRLLKTPRRTKERIANIKKVIDALRDSDLRRDEIGDLLGVTASGSRKYAGHLLEFKVIELARFDGGSAFRLGHPVYKLTDDEQHVDDFLASLDAGGVSNMGGDTSKKTQLALAQAMPGRHFHFLADDITYAVRIDRTPIHRHPQDEWFFGPARARQDAQVGA